MIMGHKRPYVLLFILMCLAVEGRRARHRTGVTIVGGDVVRPNSLPYQVSLQVRVESE